MRLHTQRNAGAVLGLLAFCLALPATAGSVLFSGNITTESVYTYMPALVRTASGAGTLSVGGTGPADFTVPVSALSGSATTSFSTTRYATEQRGLPGVYPNGVFTFTADVGRRNIGTGAFGAAFTPSATWTVPVNTTAYPNIATQPRSGFIRLRVGSQGFGGNLLLSDRGTYIGKRLPVWLIFFLSPANAPTLDDHYNYSGTVEFTQTAMGWIGSGPLPTGATNPSGIVGVSINTPFTYAWALPIAASTRAPWVTGTATVKHYHRGATLTFTAVGVDGRNPAGTTGTISLVTPRVLNTYVEVYNFFAGSDFYKRNQSASVSTLSLSFLPEPSRWVLIASGLVGLVALARSRR